MIFPQVCLPYRAGIGLDFIDKLEGTLAAVVEDLKVDRVCKFAIFLHTLEIGYSDTVYLSKNCHYNRLFLYQIILIGALFNQVHNQN